ncbi:MAG: hypothetical protein G01um101448_106 [Parcubacteria group bacterium Gr01-1014_48]|nr:MAG: hypothetical protein Greene041614_27 [Parcubacteria group bacterium Greene0416_14]TSC74465.1 MAG: hypothetical protein G01um101448_106 [Parcubacteria group bacterium Gr01-1014_48]TSD01775.1 MAG: hypothetical protein Greene101415_33 [Parcubacteria group bacterium Greene1014_15]TSD08489.1 MAG: hypothetical protein Greene07144_28 [Parcubacteria group bacterium Greene0714_4]
MSRLVWLHVFNRRGRILFKRNLNKNLHEIQKKILKDLRKNGIVFVKITDLISEQEWESLRLYVMNKVNEPGVQKRIKQNRSAAYKGDEKYYNIDLIESKVLDLKNPIYTWALNEKILQIANEYMGMYVKFRGVRLWASLPVPPGAPETASQRWHRDLDDRQLMKTFVYFDDVDETAGPLHYIRESHGAGTWNSVFPTPFPLGSYPPPGAIEKVIPKEYITKAVGKAGTLIFCDTSGFHKGGYCTKKNRYMLFCLYASAATIDPLGYIYPSTLDTSNLSPRARFALENEGMPS